MKKIGILTFHRSINYGAFMQCYALMNTLGKKHPDWQIEIIDYTREHTVKAYKKSHFKNLIRNPLNYPDILKRRRIFKEYLEKLPLSDFRIETDNVDEIFDAIKGKYDAVIVGSDIVFGVHKDAPFPTAYWLNSDLGCHKLSYAASSNCTDYEKLPKEYTEYIEHAVKDFDYIGVRDDGTKSFIEYIDSSLISHHNCDPTVLIDIDEIKTDMDALKEKLYKNLDKDKPVIGIMLNSPITAKMIKENFSDEYNIVSVYAKNSMADKSLYDIDIFQWARIFSFFDLTVTTFFHGSLFSLLNGTPVVSVNSSKVNEKYMGKVEDLFTRLDMKENFFHQSAIKENPKAFIDRCNAVLDDKKSDETKKYIYDKIKKESESFDEFNKVLTKLLSDGCGENNE